MSSPDVTEALAALHDGDEAARERLVRAVYDELRDIARAHLRRERADHTLVTTELVHEAYEKMLGPSAAYGGRGHFFGAASRAMRQILVDHARRRGRAKRGSGERPASLDDVGEIAAVDGSDGIDIVDLDDALTRLAEMDPRQAAVVECRYFGGLTVEETAEALDISDSTVKREWRIARAWLYAALRADEDASSTG
jgi:RNA polymerase sigma factor (TIGR02999 family)